MVILVVITRCNSLVKGNPSYIKIISQIQNCQAGELEENLKSIIQDSILNFELQYLITKLPSGLSEKYFNRVTDLNLRNIYFLNKYYENYQVNAYDRLFQKLNINKENKVLHFEYLNHLIKSESEEEVDYFEFIINQNVEEFSNIELDSYLHLLKTLGLSVYEYDKTLGFSILNYCLHILAQSQLNDDYKLFIGDLFYNIGESLTQESISEIELAEDYFQLAITKYSKLNLNSKILLCKTALLIHEKDLRNKNIISVDSIANLKLSKRRKVFIATDHGVSFLDADPSKAIKYLNFALDEIDEGGCFRYKNVIVNLIGLCQFKLGVHKEALRNFDSTWKLDDCNLSNQFNSKFYNITIQKDLMPALLQNYIFEDGINIRLQQRSLADSINMSSDHLGDFFSVNTIEILDLIKKQNKLDSSKVKQVLSLLDDTKSRELKRVRKQNDEQDKSKYSSEIKDLLRQIDNFKKIDDWSNPAYAKLFELTIKQHLEKKEVETIKKSPIDYSRLKEKLKDDELQIIEFIAYDDVYAGYSFSHDGMKLTQFDRTAVDSSISILLNKIKNRNSIDSIAQILTKQIFEDLNINDSKSILILPDGPLVNIPFHLFFDQSIRHQLSIPDFINEEQVYVSKNNLTLLSYSSLETYEEKKLNEYLELMNGYEECLSINNMVEERGILLAGLEANKANLIKSMSSDILHVALHGSTNMKNRYDNYLVTRKNDFSTEKVYSYQIEVQNQCPEVVILSACETGVGAFDNGVGTYSISRAFLSAGANAVVKSLWKVNDMSTQVFMKYLYSKWLEGSNLQEALNFARAKMQENPKYTEFDWAGFVLEGNGNYYIQ